MPYTVEELKKDSRFKGLPVEALKIFVAAFNAALEQYDGDEEKAFAVAWAAVKKKFRKTESGEWEKFSVTRPAKLFEAGDYPDKGLEVSEEDLDALISGTERPIPIKIEHVDTPLDGAIGYVTELWRKGKELFGNLSFTDEAWALLKKVGAKALSCGIRRDKSAIAEVSLVKNPRIADAQVFSEDIVGFSSNLDWPEDEEEEEVVTETEVLNMANDENRMSVQEALNIIRQLRPDSPEAKAVWDAAKELTEFTRASEEELQRTAEMARAAVQELQKANTERLISTYKRQGKLTPSIEKYARALFRARPLSGGEFDRQQLVTFEDESGEEVTLHFAEVFEKFLEAMPPIVKYDEIVKDGKEDVLTPDAADFLKNKLGVDPEKVAEVI